MPKGRTVRSNERLVTIPVFGPGDAWSHQAASLGVMTNTFSPASKGVQPQITGLSGYGVNRWTGATSYALQRFTGVSSPVLYPQSAAVGIGVGVAGQPGWPSTGTMLPPTIAGLANANTYTGIGG
jgi:hypothetical protein